MLLASLSAVTGLSTVSKFCYQTLPTAKKCLYQFLTGREHAPSTGKVIWGWSEPQTVGKTMTFRVKFFRKNGSPCPASDDDEIVIEIVHDGMQVARTVQFSREESVDVDFIKCSFTVHKSGVYQVSVMVGGKHIENSPFIKNFEAGLIDPSKTSFLHFTSAVVFPCARSYPLIIEPRDSFGNLSVYKPDCRTFFKIIVTETLTNKRYYPTIQIINNTQNKKLVMYIRIDKEGSYKALVSYGDVKLSNGEFDILVLSVADLNKVQKNITTWKHSLHYEAQLLSQNSEKLEKPKKVQVFISPKKVTIKENYFKICTRKLFTFHICPWTKLVFSKTNNQAGAPVLCIEDKNKCIVELATPDCNIIAGTFSYFLLKSIGGSESFRDKQSFFHRQIRAIHHKKSDTNIQFSIDRSNILYSSYKTTKHLKPLEWHKRFELNFSGEQGLDWGGVSREWFELLCKELFDPNCSKLFTRLSDDIQGLVHPNVKRPPDKKVKLYEFAGKVVGKCLLESSLGRTQLVKARFTKSFLAQLIGLRVTYKHFETDDPEFYHSKISYIENNSVKDMELTFSEEVYNAQGMLIKEVDLIPNGSKIAVTDSNKLHYLNTLAQHRLVTPIKEEVESFKRGLSSEFIPEKLLRIFDESELEMLMCGIRSYSVTDFKLHHLVMETSPAFSKVINWFWTIIESYTDELMAWLLQFTTGSSQLPPGGFSELDPKIQLLPVPTCNTLPSSHTCFNQLCLPDYDSMETFQKMLLIAITEGNQGFTMI